MFDLLALAATIAASAFGYITARRFVRDRLKYVDGAQTVKAPIIAGVVAWAIAMPITWLVPLIGVGTAILFGASVALGVRAGARDIRVDRRISAGS
ncbi:MAG TPA: hypothetical protein VJ867_00970 [Gemmatimonadaceae bacterium]|nr:hypothetical protein [Gemmatimonadaceae bacterium]